MFKRKLEYRVRETEKGWISEQSIDRKLFGITLWSVWRPFVTSSGLDSPWYSKTKELCLLSFYSKLKEEKLK